MLNSIRNVKFIKMRKLTMFITAVCVLFLKKFSIVASIRVCRDGFERRTLTESGLFALFSRDFEHIFGQIFFIRIQTLSTTNLVASRHIKREKSSLRVDVHGSKTLLLKVSNTLTTYELHTLQPAWQALVGSFWWVYNALACPRYFSFRP